MSFKFKVELCGMTMKNDIKIKEELTCRFKSNMNLSHKIWPEHSKSLKKIFNWLLVNKIYIIWATKVQRSDAEELCKFWRKTDQWFEKGHEKFGKFSPEYLKVPKLGLWWDPFVQSRNTQYFYFSVILLIRFWKIHVSLLQQTFLWIPWMKIETQKGF